MNASPGDTELFEPLVRSILDWDQYFVCADFAAYRDCQNLVSAAYRDTQRWARMSIANAAHTGKFSSDRTIREYCEDIWRVGPVPIPAVLEATESLDGPSEVPFPVRAAFV